MRFLTSSCHAFSNDFCIGSWARVLFMTVETPSHARLNMNSLMSWSLTKLQKPHRSWSTEHRHTAFSSTFCLTCKISTRVERCNPQFSECFLRDFVYSYGLAEHICAKIIATDTVLHRVRGYSSVSLSTKLNNILFNSFRDEKYGLIWFPIMNSLQTGMHNGELLFGCPSFRLHISYLKPFDRCWQNSICGV
jgi:hypothetical protein